MMLPLLATLLGKSDHWILNQLLPWAKDLPSPLLDRLIHQSIEDGTLAEVCRRSFRGHGALKAAAFFKVLETHQAFLKSRTHPTFLIEPSTPRRLKLPPIPDALRTSDTEWIGFIPDFGQGFDDQEVCVIAHGSSRKVELNPRMLFQRTLSLGATGFALIHNHPSGSLNPSQADRMLTDQVRRLCAQFDLTFHGHAIVTSLNHAWIQLE